MSADTIAIISTGVALALLIIGLFAWLRADIQKLDGRVAKLDERITRLDERVARLEERVNKLDERQSPGSDERVTRLDERVTRLDERVTRLEVELRERMAKLEGLLEGLREAVTGKTRRLIRSASPVRTLGRRGSGHLAVRRGDRTSQLPMHGSHRELGTRLIAKIKNDLGL